MIGIRGKASTAHVLCDMGCLASSPQNLAKDLQGRYAAPFLHTASDQKLEVGKA